LVGITELISKLKDSFEMNAKNESKINAITKNGPAKLATDHEISN